jgi:hypothetical protein
MTRQWLLYEFTTDGLPLSPSSPYASPVLSRNPSPAQELLMQSMHQSPLRPQSPLKLSSDLIADHHRPRSLSDPRPRYSFFLFFFFLFYCVNII